MLLCRSDKESGFISIHRILMKFPGREHNNSVSHFFFLSDQDSNMCPNIAQCYALVCTFVVTAEL